MSAYLEHRGRWVLGALAVTALSVTAGARKAGPVAYRPATPVGLDLFVPVPADNPLRPEVVALGRRLFFDPVLSDDFTVACASCHDPRRAFSDGLPRAVGVRGRTTSRHAPALVNRAYGDTFFWDGRAASLEAQVLQPIEHPDELGSSISSALARLRANREYDAAFSDVFGRSPDADALARALASYVRTIVSGDTPFDRFRHGDQTALNGVQRMGLAVFAGKGHCTRCHVGANLTDEGFHNTGVALRSGRLADAGRADVTGDPGDQGRFKTPTLREVARTAPYMHDGSLATLDDVIDFYDAGGRPNPYLDSNIEPLALSPDERVALRAFLRSLTGTVREGRLTPVR